MLASDWGSRPELAKSDSLAIVRATSASIDKRWMEPMHIEVLVIDEEALAYCRVAVIQCMNIEPRRQSN